MNFLEDLKTFVKKLISNYHKPTPEKWQRIGKALLRTSVFLSGSAIVINCHTLALIVLIMGGIGEFVTNFYTEDDQNSPSAQ